MSVYVDVLNDECVDELEARTIALTQSRRESKSSDDIDKLMYDNASSCPSVGHIIGLISN